MSTPASALRTLLPLPRVLLELHGAKPGPLLLVVAGIHGNEPAGVLAALRRLGALRGLEDALRGDVVALVGNRGALARGVRCLDRDLNRGWRPAASLVPAPAPLTRTAAASVPAEDREQEELTAALEAALAAARGPVHFLDLHTTSADGIPFALVEDEPRAQRFAGRFGLSVVLGLLGSVQSTLLTYMSVTRDVVSLGVEAGGNDNPHSIQRHEAVLSIALEAAGLVDAARLPELGAALAQLRAARGPLPAALVIRERHTIQPDDGFRMEPGFANIERVTRGQLLARDRRGEIRAPGDGYVVLPLYQANGSDGFFFAVAQPAAP